eukprot:8929394-Pyramimonas_sp.AAC.1
MLVSSLTFLRSSNAFDRLVMYSCMLSPGDLHTDLSYSAPSNSSAARTGLSFSTDSPSVFNNDSSPSVVALFFS